MLSDITSACAGSCTRNRGVRAAGGLFSIVLAWALVGCESSALIQMDEILDDAMPPVVQEKPDQDTNPTPPEDQAVQAVAEPQPAPPAVDQTQSVRADEAVAGPQPAVDQTQSVRANDWSLSVTTEPAAGAEDPESQHQAAADEQDADFLFEYEDGDYAVEGTRSFEVPVLEIRDNF